MPSTDPLDLIDSLLGDVLASGWGDEPAAKVLLEPAKTPPPPEVKQVLLEPEYPPLPVKGGMPPAVKRTRAPLVDKAQALALAKEAMDEGGITYMDGDDTPPETDEEPRGALLNIGLLTDLATGRKSALDAAEAAGITPAEVQTQLATALRDVDPKEIAKALALQAGEQQLKSGAIYGVVLHELVTDMMQNRLTPSLKIELAKLLANVGKIMPKEDKTVAAGSGFTLNISMGASPQPVTIEAE